MKPTSISSCVLAMCIALFGLAVLIGRYSRPEPVAAPTLVRPSEPGPQSVLIQTGSVEHRVRAMEAQLLGLRNRVETLEAAKN